MVNNKQDDKEDVSGNESEKNENGISHIRYRKSNSEVI